MFASTAARRPVMYRVPHQVPRMRPRSADSVTNVGFTNLSLVVRLADGCVLSVPLSWYPRLKHATPAVRNNWNIATDGNSVHWPDIDVRFSVADLSRPIESSRVAE